MFHLRVQRTHYRMIFWIPDSHILHISTIVKMGYCWTSSWILMGIFTFVSTNPPWTPDRVDTDHCVCLDTWKIKQYTHASLMKHHKLVPLSCSCWTNHFLHHAISCHWKWKADSRWNVSGESAVVFYPLFSFRFPSKARCSCYSFWYGPFTKNFMKINCYYRSHKIWFLTDWAFIALDETNWIETRVHWNNYRQLGKMLQQEPQRKLKDVSWTQKNNLLL